MAFIDETRSDHIGCAHQEVGDLANASGGGGQKLQGVFDKFNQQTGERSKGKCADECRKLWFCTNNTKDVYKDMQENPEVEISVSSPEYAWIRLHGKAVFENNMAAKEMCIQNPIVKGQYGEATNPIFEVFYLDNAHGVIADFSGNPPYEF